jgi:hypothetical protein
MTEKISFWRYHDHIIILRGIQKSTTCGRPVAALLPQGEYSGLGGRLRPDWVAGLTSKRWQLVLSPA